MTLNRRICDSTRDWTNMTRFHHCCGITADLTNETQNSTCILLPQVMLINLLCVRRTRTSKQLFAYFCAFLHLFRQMVHITGVILCKEHKYAKILRHNILQGGCYSSWYPQTTVKVNRDP